MDDKIALDFFHQGVDENPVKCDEFNPSKSLVSFFSFGFGRHLKKQDQIGLERSAR